MSKQPPSEDQPDSDGSSVNGSPTNESLPDAETPDSRFDDREDGTEILATDPDPVQLGDAAAVITETGAAAPPESDTVEVEAERARLDDLVGKPGSTVTPKPPTAKSSPPWFGIFNFLLILALAGTAAYFWRQQQNLDASYQANLTAQQSTMAELQLELQAVEQSSSKRLQSSLSPLANSIDSLSSEVAELGLGQQSLRESGEKLYQLFGRDRNAWQLAEVEYLMRVAQHKLILQDDFAGAAITLQAASDRIGLTGDPGLLPVRVIISEEIADLKTRRRADLVGMSLMLAQLGRRVRGLQPGFALRVEQSSELPAAEESVMVGQASEDWVDRFSDFLDSLISIRKESTEPTEIEANIIDVTEAMEDNLKLARWSVLERDANQYQLLIDRSLSLFREFYDLDNVANHEFMTELQELQKMVIKPEKPDITGSLRELQRILSQRAVAPQPETPQPETLQLEDPQPAVEPAPESGNG
jgi:uroporphyrin-3 C-methyltransferase